MKEFLVWQARARQSARRLNVNGIASNKLKLSIINSSSPESNRNKDVRQAQVLSLTRYTLPGKLPIQIPKMPKQRGNMIFNYWGKADPAYPHEQKWHPLVYHCLDVAAVGVAYLEQSSFLGTCCGLLNCSKPTFLSWSAFLLALHDLGKFSEAFQSQRQDLISELQKREPNPNKVYSERHDSLGFCSGITISLTRYC